MFDETSQAFSTPAANLNGERLELHLDGDLTFEQTFVTAPATVNPGLGPVFNATSCEACHARDGRTRDALLMRLSVEGAGPDGGPNPVPGYGTQLQDRAIFGYAPEGRLEISYVEESGAFSDGTTYGLREPAYQIIGPYTTFPRGVLQSPRVPRPVFGLGLLEAIGEDDLLDLADPDDTDGDGISGRVNRVRDVSTGTMRVGRFGWKANQASLLDQVAAAYVHDIGVTSAVFPHETAEGQPPHEDGLLDDPEIDDDVVAATTFYVQTLAVPAPRNIDDPMIERGERLFAKVGCTGCHVPRMETATLADIPEVSDQVIFPYTDLLLHDMGSGLADGRPDWSADGREWRTPPLWGLGLSLRVNGHTNLLHDGRARSVAEAILWHGGEGSASRDAFRALDRDDRSALLAFLESL